MLFYECGVGISPLPVHETLSIAFNSLHLLIPPAAKKNPREDLAHLRYDNQAPLVEGEASMVRAGSDSFLNEHNGVSDSNFIEVSAQ